MILGLVAVIALLVVAAAWRANRWWNESEAAFEREIEALGLKARYAEITAEIAAGRLTVEQAVGLRNLDLNAARIARDFAAMSIPAGQYAVMEARDPTEEKALDLLVQRGLFKKAADRRYVYDPKR